MIHTGRVLEIWIRVDETRRFSQKHRTGSQKPFLLLQLLSCKHQWLSEPIEEHLRICWPNVAQRPTWMHRREDGWKVGPSDMSCLLRRWFLITQNIITLTFLKLRKKLPRHPNGSVHWEKKLLWRLSNQCFTKMCRVHSEPIQNGLSVVQFIETLLKADFLRVVALFLRTGLLQPSEIESANAMSKGELYLQSSPPHKFLSYSIVLKRILPSP